MIDSLRETVSERVSGTQLLLLLGLTAATSGWVDTTLSAVTLPAVGELTRAILVNTAVYAGWTLFFAGNDTVVRKLDLPERASNAGLGAATLAAATGLRVAFGVSQLFTAALLLVGAWFLLDGVQSIRHDDRATDGERPRRGDDSAAGDSLAAGEGSTVDDGRLSGDSPTTDHPARDGEAVYAAYVARRVHETVREEPQTRHDLVDELDADAETVETAVDRLLEEGVLDSRAGRLEAAETTDRLSEARDAVSDAVGGAVDRLARPFTVEFADGDEPDTPAATRPAGSFGDEGSRSTTTGDAERETVAGDGERETVVGDAERDTATSERADGVDSERDDKL
ncbi:MAG: hypothetical protein ABEH80_01840, partial [Halobaculum sp.]